MRPEMFLWDGGTCRHIINGEYFWQHHVLPTTNYTSAIFNDSPCLTRCWLGDVASGLVYNNFAMTGIVLIFSIVGALGLMWSYQMARARGMGLLAGLLLVLLVMPAVGMHWSARCHVYTYLPFLVLYYLLFMNRSHIAIRAAGVVAVMAVWANLHGSYTIGTIVLLVAAVASCLKAFAGNFLPLPAFKPDPQSKKEAIETLVLFVAGLAATLMNPRGLAFYSTVLTYISNPVVLSKTDEWRSLDLTAGVGVWFFLLLGGLVLFAMVKTRGGLNAPETAVMGMLCVASIVSMRMVPYCSLMMIPFLGPYWASLKPTLLAAEPEAGGLIKGNLHKLAKLESRIEGDEPSGWKPALIYVLITVVMSVAFLKLDMFEVKDFDAERIPVKLVACLKEANPPGLGFNYDNWGGYIYFKLRKTVYIDDWADFLPMPFIEEYLQILLTQPGWEAKFDKYKFNWVMVPKDAQLAQVLIKNPDWEVKCKDEAGILFLRKSAMKPAINTTP